jgi:hypothetical protein
MAEPAPATTAPAISAAPHPEEIKASVDLHLGRSIALSATFRTTPAGLVAAGIMVSAIVLSTALLVRTARRR